MDKHYLSMQKKLNDKFAMISVETEAWEEQKEIMKSKVNLDSEVVKLNVGGQTHI